MKKLSALAVLIPVFGLVVYTLFTTVAKADTSQLPNVPPGYEMVDLITDNGFENSTGGFAVMGSAAEGSVAQTSVNPIQGSKSLSLTVNSYGRVGFGNIFPWEGGPFSDSLTVKAKIRVESGNSGRQLKVCSIAYIQNNNEPLNTCQNFPINNQNVADVYLTQSLSAKQLYMAFFQFSLENSGSVVVTVDDAHLYVVRAQSNTPPPPTPVNGVCGSANGTTVPTIPTTNLCSVGAASSVNGSGPWTWTCAGT
ncbi:MAG TPA: hypothetical protein VLK22_02560, partial [Candidatus Udaeobacter sp.]|nr:hypothetical protein [Candidatus Udaeobacter sp.]